jgi:hypothetical protein
MDRPEQTAVAPYVMVVQQGDEERYQLLRKLFQSQRVDVVLDRRTGDRRGPGASPSNGNGAGTSGNGSDKRDADRRAGERRSPLPDTWVNLGFFVARRQVNRPPRHAAPVLGSDRSTES